MDRKSFLQSVAGSSLGMLGALPVIQEENLQANTAEKLADIKSSNDFYISNRAPLKAEPYTELPIGAIQPKGWLREQLKRQCSGLTGHLDEKYETVVGPTNGWLGGDGWF